MMIKALVAAAVMAMSAGAMAQTVVQKDVHKEVTVQRHDVTDGSRHSRDMDRGEVRVVERHDNGLHRGHAYGHRMHRMHREEMMQRRMMHREMMRRHRMHRDEMHHGSVKHVEKHVMVDANGNKVVHKTVTKN